MMELCGSLHGGSFWLGRRGREGKRRKGERREGEEGDIPPPFRSARREVKEARGVDMIVVLL